MSKRQQDRFLWSEQTGMPRIRASRSLIDALASLGSAEEIAEELRPLSVSARDIVLAEFDEELEVAIRAALQPESRAEWSGARARKRSAGWSGRRARRRFQPELARQWQQVETDQGQFFIGVFEEHGHRVFGHFRRREVVLIGAQRPNVFNSVALRGEQVEVSAPELGRVTAGAETWDVRVRLTTEAVDQMVAGTDEGQRVRSVDALGAALAKLWVRERRSGTFGGELESTLRVYSVVESIVVALRDALLSGPPTRVAGLTRLPRSG